MVLELEEKKNTNAFNMVWRIHLVYDLVYEENDVDCGVFVCYFFECLSIGVKLSTGTMLDVCGHNISVYHKLLAFCYCAGKYFVIERNSGTVRVANANVELLEYNNFII